MVLNFGEGYYYKRFEVLDGWWWWGGEVCKGIFVSNPSGVKIVTAGMCIETVWAKCLV